MLCRRRIATTILLLLLGLALLGQPSALSIPRNPSDAPSSAARDHAAPVATTDTTFVTSTTATTVPATDVTTAVADATVTAAEEPPGLVGKDPGPDASPTPTPSPVPTPPVDTPPVDASGLTITTTASKMLTQVGGNLSYRVHVTNGGAETLQGVTIVTVIPDELDAGALEVSDEVEAAFHGSSPTAEDIVWVLKDLAPGSTVVLPWQAKAVSRGDLRAVTSTRAKVADVRVDDAETTTYLATAGKRAPHNPVPTVKRRVVTYKSVPVPAEEQPSFTGAPAAGSPLGTATDPLPLTGSDPKPLVIAGFILVALGLALAFAPKRLDRRKLLIVSLVVLTACVDATQSNDEASGPSTTVKDEVKGTRFGNNNGNNGNGSDNGPGEGPSTTTTLPFAPVDEPGTTDTTAAPGEPAPTLVAEVPQPTVTTLVRQVSFETVPADLPSEELESRDGDNTVTVDWSEDEGIVSAASSLFVQKDPPVEIMSTVSERNGTLHMDVTLTNVQESNKMIVKGHLVHTITAADGTTTRLRSDPYDLVLNPDGTVQAHFSYLLPTGAYTLTSAFEADA